MDRTIAPQIGQNFKIEVPKAETCTLKDGTRVHLLNMGSEETIRISFLTESGAWFQPKPLVAIFTQQMLNKGTLSKSSFEVSERMDYFGAYSAFGTGMHFGVAHFYLLNKYLDRLIPLIGEIINAPSFPENELQILVENQRQNYLINKNKVAYVAAREFDKALFGKGHPYGNKAELSDFDKVTIDDIKAYFKNVTKSNSLQIVISGKIPDNIIQLLDEHVAINNDQKTPYTISFGELPEVKKLTVHKQVKDAVQSGIKAGFKTITRTHPDYFKLKILNTVLGGYFGSRLMQNIREEKGYTYGIHSALVPYHKTAMLAISTETANEYRDDVCKEIDFEIQRLMTEPIDDEELTKVKNYMFNDLLRSMDQAFSYGDVYQSLLEFEMTPEYLVNSVNVLRDISSKELQQVANCYLHPSEMIYSIAGK